MTSFTERCRLRCCQHAFCYNCLVRSLDVRRRCPICSAPASSSRYPNPSSSSSGIDTAAFDEAADTYDDIIIKNYYSDIVPFIDKLASLLMTPIASSSSSSSSAHVKCDGISILTEPPCIEEEEEEQSSSMSSLALTNQSVMTLLQLKDRQRKKLSSSNSLAVHKPGDAVTVLPRLWPGMNKPGGPAYVVRVNGGSPDGGGRDCTYDVKYILASSEDCDVPAVFLTAIEALDRKARKREAGEGGDTKENGDMDSNAASDSRAAAPNGGKKAKPSAKTKAITVSKFHPLYKTASPPKIIILTTLESEADCKQLTRFTKLFSCSTVVTDFENVSGVVTHLVVGTDSKGVMQSRTMKYLKAVMQGIWVVDSRWVSDSCNAALILNEDDYEIKKVAKGGVACAARRARLAISNPIINFADCTVNTAVPASSTAGSRDDLLFSGKAFSLHGGFCHPGPARSDIEQLLLAGGGSVRAAPANPNPNPNPDSATSSSGAHIALCSDEEAKASVIGSLDRPEGGTCNSSNNNSKVQIVSPLWLFDCIGSYTFIADFSHDKYSTFGKKERRL